MSDNNLFKAIDKLYFLLIKEKGFINVNHVEIIDYKGDNLRLR